MVTVSNQSVLSQYVQGGQAMTQVTFEQPLNERLRTFLRLELLFQEADYSLNGPSQWDSRYTISSLISIMNIFIRTDLKTEIIKELERLSLSLERIKISPNVDSQKLNTLLDDMNQLIDKLYTTQGQIGTHLRQNDFLSSIKQRSSVPGGTCDFDIPAFHLWLQQNSESRILNLKQWMASFEDVRSAISLIIRLVRESTVKTSETAYAGFLQKPLDSNTHYQLVRVSLARECGLFAEISAGKHRFTIRFLEMNLSGRHHQTSKDIDFELTCCAI